MFWPKRKYQPAVEGIIESYELAFRMQDVMPEMMDVSKETPCYPCDCMEQILALLRRLVSNVCLLDGFAEAGVRFIEVTHGNWDQHTNLTADHKARAEGCDKPIAGLLAGSETARHAQRYACHLGW